jgi:hypothetical protein
MKLQKEDGYYYLMEDGNDIAIATTDQSFIDELGAMKLSKQNCDEIFGVVEIEVEIEMTEDYLTWKKSDIEKLSDCLVPKLDENSCLILKKK